LATKFKWLSTHEWFGDRVKSYTTRDGNEYINLCICINEKKNYKQVWKAKIRKQFDGKIYERAPEQNPGKYVCAAGKKCC